MRDFNELDFLSRFAAVSSNDKNASKFLMSKMEDENFSTNLETLYNYEIVGKRVMTLFTEACFGRENYFNLTLSLFRMGTFSKTEIISNLDSEIVVPFIDRNTYVVGKQFLNEKNIKDFAQLNKAIFVENKAFVKKR